MAAMTADADDALRVEMSEQRLKKQRQAAGAEDAEMARSAGIIFLGAVRSAEPLARTSGGQRVAGVGR